MEKHIGMITISEELLLKLLDFDGGAIRNVRLGWTVGEVELLIEHPDMPIIGQGMTPLPITPLYSRTYGDNGCLIRIERSSPPKQGE